MSNITISKVKPSEWRNLQSLAIKTFKDTYESKNTPEIFANYVTKAFNQKQVNSALQSEKSHFYFLSKADKIIGYLKLNEPGAQSDINGKNTLELERIYITKQFHGHGFGRLLINKSIEVARALGFKKVWLGVWEENPKAIAFYKRMGFEKFGTHTFHLGDDQQIDYLFEINI